MSFPLNGVRIVDLTWMLASAGGPKLLSALGAEVIRVEWKERLDQLRQRGPAPAPEGGRVARNQATGPIAPAPSKSVNRSGFFNDINAGRMGVSLNMRHPKGKELFARLVEVSDVVVEGFTARTMEKWGFGYDTLRRINPTIIYVQQSAFGRRGNYADYRALGPVAQALSGLTEQSGLPDPYPPAGWGYSYLDWFGGYNCALAVIAAVYSRRRTGRGQYIDGSQVEPGIYLTGTAVLDYTANGRHYRRTGNRSPYKAAAPHGAYRCSGKNRWVAIAVSTDEEWAAFCRVLGNPAWTQDPRFHTLEGRVQHQDDLDQRVESWTRERDAYQVMEALQQGGVSAGVCQTAGDRVDRDPQLKHLRWLTELPHSEIGTWPVKGFPARFSRTPAYQGGIINRASPCYGEDNGYVYREVLGISEGEVAGLAAEGVV